MVTVGDGTAAEPGHVALVDQLAVSPASPSTAGPVTVSFTVTNGGGSPISVNYLLAGARTASGGNVDFPTSAPVTLQPGQRYTYSASRTLAAGRHTAWPAYYDGSDWHELADHTTVTVQPTSAEPVLIGAGGIASCGSSGDEATAAVLDGISGTVFTPGLLQD